MPPFFTWPFSEKEQMLLYVTEIYEACLMAFVVYARRFKISRYATGYGVLLLAYNLSCALRYHFLL